MFKLRPDFTADVKYRTV